MTIKRGLSNIRRVHGKNFIHAKADARLNEVIASQQSIGQNALGVDYHEVYLYIKSMSSRVCTCREIQTVVNEMSISDTSAPKFSGIGREQEISLDWNRPLFGERFQIYETDDEQAPDDSMYELDDERSVINHTVESSPDCGICYRTGFVPGFEQYGKMRHVFTTHDVVDMSGTTIDRSMQPHQFECLTPKSFVAFELRVPKYFKDMQFSVRNNLEQLSERLMYNDHYLTLQDLRDNCGKTVIIHARAAVFTHVVIVFDLGSDPIRANIAQISKITDWTQFEAIGNLNVVLPMTIPELPVGSLIYVPRTNLGLRITDVQYLRVARGANIDWSCSTRVMQPMESTKLIAKGFKLL